MSAVPSMMAAMPVVEPSAAMLKVTPGWDVLVRFGQLGDELGAEGVGAFDDEFAVRVDGANGENRGDGESEEVFHF